MTPAMIRVESGHVMGVPELKCDEWPQQLAVVAPASKMLVDELLDIFGAEDALRSKRLFAKRVKKQRPQLGLQPTCEWNPEAFLRTLNDLVWQSPLQCSSQDIFTG